jgi:hypothetical protein
VLKNSSVVFDSEDGSTIDAVERAIYSDSFSRRRLTSLPKISLATIAQIRKALLAFKGWSVVAGDWRLYQSPILPAAQDLFGIIFQLDDKSLTTFLLKVLLMGFNWAPRLHKPQRWSSGVLRFTEQFT